MSSMRMHTLDPHSAVALKDWLLKNQTVHYNEFDGIILDQDFDYNAPLLLVRILKACL